MPLTGFLGGAFGLLAMDATDPSTLYLGETDDEDGIYSLLKSSDALSICWRSIRQNPARFTRRPKGSTPRREAFEDCSRAPMEEKVGLRPTLGWPGCALPE
jgi:hypothetical protein